MSTLPNDDYDFGFSFADEETLPSAPVKNNSNDEIAVLQAKIDSLLDSQEKVIQSAMSAAIEEKYKSKLREVEGLIMPLLLNLKKNPDKAYINWPNRVPVIDKQIEKITAVTRS
jgi:hypothetical protein